MTTPNTSRNTNEAPLTRQEVQQRIYHALSEMRSWSLMDEPQRKATYEKMRDEYNAVSGKIGGWVSSQFNPVSKTGLGFLLRAMENTWEGVTDIASGGYSVFAATFDKTFGNGTLIMRASDQQLQEAAERASHKWQAAQTDWVGSIGDYISAFWKAISFSWPPFDASKFKAALKAAPMERAAIAVNDEIFKVTGQVRLARAVSGIGVDSTLIPGAVPAYLQGTKEGEILSEVSEENRVLRGVQAPTMAGSVVSEWKKITEEDSARAFKYVGPLALGACAYQSAGIANCAKMIARSPFTIPQAIARAVPTAIETSQAAAARVAASGTVTFIGKRALAVLGLPLGILVGTSSAAQASEATVVTALLREIEKDPEALAFITDEKLQAYSAYIHADGQNYRQRTELKQQITALKAEPGPAGDATVLAGLETKLAELEKTAEEFNAYSWASFDSHRNLVQNAIKTLLTENGWVDPKNPKAISESLQQIFADARAAQAAYIESQKEAALKPLSNQALAAAHAGIIDETRRAASQAAKSAAASGVVATAEPTPFARVSDVKLVGVTRAKDLPEGNAAPLSTANLPAGAKVVSYDIATIV